MNFRQIKSDEWIKGDYREFVHINIKTSNLAEKFNIKFEDYLEDGLGKSKIAAFISEKRTQFYITAFPFNQVVQTYLGCLNNPETIAKDIDEILELLELSSENVLFIYESIQLISHELWRQDDNGHKFLIETFACKADAVKAMKEFEARLHKQTYWVEKAES